MIIRLKTKTNRNGNSYGLIVNTERKHYRAGWGLVAFGADFIVSKKDIEQFIKYNLKIIDYTEVEK